MPPRCNGARRIDGVCDWVISSRDASTGFVHGGGSLSLFVGPVQVMNDEVRVVDGGGCNHNNRNNAALLELFCPIPVSTFSATRK
jgi:hypothetical protein